MFLLLSAMRFVKNGACLAFRTFSKPRTTQATLRIQSFFHMPVGPPFNPHDSGVEVPLGPDSAGFLRGTDAVIRSN